MATMFTSLPGTTMTFFMVFPTSWSATACLATASSSSLLAVAETFTRARTLPLI